MNPKVTRLAPSPTGALHLGNARTFLANWLMARQAGWSILLRIEDLDASRSKPASEQQTLDDLGWLGLDWDTGPVYQSQRRPLYAAAIDRLLSAGLAYPCICTRRDAALAASAPHREDATPIYSGVCRDRFASVDDARRQSGREPSIRFRLPAGPAGIVKFDDAIAGHIRIDAPRELGDCVIRRADGAAAYQLAVVVDDADANVTDVVRGDDLIPSTAWQLLLYDALGLSARRPRYAHVPLVVGQDGARLAKRHGDSRLSHYRALGVPAARILQLLAHWLAIDASPKSAADLIGRLDLSRISRQHIVFDAQTEQSLLKGLE